MIAKNILNLFLKIFGRSLLKNLLGFIFLFILVIGFYFISYSKSIDESGLNEYQQKEERASDISNKEGPYKVLRVVDGDTIDVEVNGVENRVRLIGVNTPEIVDPRKSVECFGLQASDYTKSILTGQSIYIERDSTQGEKDKYGRSLAYIFLEDGSFLNLKLIMEGYAYEYTYQIPYKYQSEFQEAQRLAQKEKIGLWGDTVCFSD
uniref:Nuclease n=1 Tax=candidate division CPR3 bacterium TaxID=2268181 RepID=A0A7C4R5I7_UNCC3